MNVPMHVTRAARRSTIVVGVSLLIGGSGWPGNALTGVTIVHGQTVNAQAATQQEFQKRLKAYIDLRTTLANKLKPLSQTSSTAELRSGEQSLAAAMKEAREGAKRGDLIPPDAEQLIRKVITRDLHRRRPAATRATLEGVPEGVTPAINKTLPATVELSTVPPLLLQELPKLPDNIQYRFVGRHVILLDGDTQQIIDYITNVLPPH